MLQQDVSELLAEEKVAYDAMASRLRNGAAAGAADIDLNMRIKIVDGDEVMACRPHPRRLPAIACRPRPRRLPAIACRPRLRRLPARLES